VQLLKWIIITADQFNVMIFETVALLHAQVPQRWPDSNTLMYLCVLGHFQALLFAPHVVG
jgi:hypothetical protein